MEYTASAKINLMLHITGKRDDGYHLMQSFMAFSDFGDRISIEEAGAYTLTVTGPFSDHAPSDKNNLVMRAVRLMEAATGKNCPLSIELEKNIPAGAGLGGGSSDAAVVMRALNDHWGQALSDDALTQLGLQLGAELPVCLAGKPCWVDGVGDVIKPVPFDGAHVVLLWPGQALSTQNVFDHFRAQKTDFSDVLDVPSHITIDWLVDQHNDLTTVAQSLCTPIAASIGAFKDREGCLFARMTGSGSTVFGVFDTDKNAKKAANDLSAAFENAWVKICRLMPS